MLHVFVETNWVVDFAAPAHYRVPAAVRLLERARGGELRLHLPVICLSEARRPILKKHQSHRTEIGKFLKWAKRQDLVTANDDSATRRVLGLLELEVQKDIKRLDTRLESLTHETNVDVFPFDGEMAQKTVALSLGKTHLEPFDQAVLAAVLVRAGTLRSEGETEFAFCELDRDLQAWDKESKRKEPLTSLYDHAGIWVYGDFVLKWPRRPDGWQGNRPTSIPSQSH